MPTLAEIGANINNLAPTNVINTIVRKYMMPNALFNLMPFVPAGTGMLGGGSGMVYKAPYAEDPQMAVNRKIGEEVAASNEDIKHKLLELKIIAQEYNSDSAVKKSFNPGSSVETPDEFQVHQATDKVINKFIYDFINGDGVYNPDGFTGLKKFFEENPGQLNDTPITVDEFTTRNALNIELFLGNSISKIKGDPTVIITTRTNGKSFLRTLNGYRYRGVDTININNVEYDRYTGIYVIGLEDKFFSNEMLQKGIPFIFAKFSESIDGIRTIVPVNGPVIDYIEPTNGVLVKTGAVQLVSVPVLVDPYCASMCYIKWGGAGAMAANLNNSVVGVLGNSKD